MRPGRAFKKFLPDIQGGGAEQPTLALSPSLFLSSVSENPRSKKSVFFFSVSRIYSPFRAASGKEEEEVEMEEQRRRI